MKNVIRNSITFPSQKSKTLLFKSLELSLYIKITTEDAIYSSLFMDFKEQMQTWNFLKIKFHLFIQKECFYVQNLMKNKQKLILRLWVKTWQKR